MNRLFFAKKLPLAASIAIAAAMALLLLFPTLCAQSCLRGIGLWGARVVPSLFPFFFFSALLLNVGQFQRAAPLFAPVTKRLFRTGGLTALIYLTSVVSGYPVGSKMIADFTSRGLIDRDEAVRASTFCSTAGPLFVVGSVGAGLFGSAVLGFKMLACHLLGGLLVGLCFRRRGAFTQSSLPPPVTPSANPLYDSIQSALSSTLTVGGFIAVFSVIGDLMTATKAISLPVAFFCLLLGGRDRRQLATGLTLGILECTGGCATLAAVGITPLSAALACAVLSFGGLSVFCQSLSFLQAAGISVRIHFYAKLLHALFAFLLCLLVCAL